MSEPSGRTAVPYYMGDEIWIRMAFTHNDQITAVDAVYTHEGDPSFALTLSGNPEPDESYPITGEGKRSVVDLSGVVDAAHLQGHYRFRRVLLYTFSGRAIYHSGFLDEQVQWPILEIREPSNRVEVSSIELDPSD